MRHPAAPRHIAAFPRHALPGVLQIGSPSPEQRAQGRPGADCARRSRAREHTGIPCAEALGQNTTGTAETSRPSPRNGFTAYTRSPRGTAFLAPVAEPAQAGRIDARVAAPEPHDFAVRSRRFVGLAEASLTPQASIATRATFRDDREAPLMAARAESEDSSGLRNSQAGILKFGSDVPPSLSPRRRPGPITTHVSC